MQLVEGLDADEKYKKWLANELGVAYSDTPPSFVKCAESDTDVSLVELKADPSRKSGYRAVSATGLVQKMKDLTIAGEWRAWDVVILCKVPHPTTAAQPEKKLKANSGTAASAVPARRQIPQTAISLPR